ncbi:MAG: division/cell wall cluster transcriptional repressor MraZ [Pseudomonadota bacterium]
MEAFVSTFDMKTDAKGRVSIPKAFREVLKAESFSGLYCIPSPDGQAIDAGGGRLFSMLQSKLDGLDPTSMEYDLLSTAFFGESEIVNVEKEGRVTLPTRFQEQADIEGDMIFVGKGYKFQIWSPGRYATYRQQALAQARTVLWGSEQPAGAMS